jgi:hypothetical protein
MGRGVSPSLGRKGQRVCHGSKIVDNVLVWLEKRYVPWVSPSQFDTILLHSKTTSQASCAGMVVWW